MTLEPALATPEEVTLALESLYGPEHDHPRFDPMEELISCILSQHTSDKLSFPAYFRMRELVGDWHAIAHAPEAAVRDSISGAGLANQKARAIQACLREIYRRTGTYSLDHLKKMPLADAREWLESLPMVGPKTSAIVLNFSFGFHIVAVDTHVHRMGLRLGWLPSKTSANAAHDRLTEIVPDGWAYRLHVQLIKHGRAVCKAAKPKCLDCILREKCPSAAGWAA